MLRNIQYSNIAIMFLIFLTHIKIHRKFDPKIEPLNIKHVPT